MLKVRRLDHHEPRPEPTNAGHIIETLLTIRDLCRILGIDRRTFERMRAAGRVPEPTMLVGTRSPRWCPKVIISWIESGGRA
jgi:predicted DNA-binding transcriptional regulator AlpA